MILRKLQHFRNQYGPTAPQGWTLEGLPPRRAELHDPLARCEDTPRLAGVDRRLHASKLTAQHEYAREGLRFAARRDGASRFAREA